MSFYCSLPSAVVRVTGSDRIAFVHGQVSNDVRGLPTPGACRALVLNAKGQLEFDLRVYRRQDDLYLHTRDGLEPALYERLKRYIIFDDVQLEGIGASLSEFHVSSDLAAPLGWRADGGELQQVEGEFGPLLLLSVNRGFVGGVDVQAPQARATDLERFWATRGEGFDAETLERARIRAGLPDAHLDGFLGRLPQECGLESAVSYRKGCYIGQEIMARLEARGNTRFALHRVSLPQAALVGASITQHGKQVGQLGSSVMDGAQAIALAVLRKDLIAEDALLADGLPLWLLPDALPTARASR